MKTEYKITRDNFDMDLAAMADNLAIEAANEIAASFKNPDGHPAYLKYISVSLPTNGCKVSMNECEKCAYVKNCMLRTFRLLCRETANVAVCNVSRYYEKLEGGAV